MHQKSDVLKQDSCFSSHQKRGCALLQQLGAGGGRGGQAGAGDVALVSWRGAGGWVGARGVWALGPQCCPAAVFHLACAGLGTLLVLANNK